MKINIYLESANRGRTMIHLLDYPGCNIKGKTTEDALKRLPFGWESYLDWRKESGFSVPDPPYEFVVAEEKLTGGPFHPGSKASFFGPDEQEVSDLDREYYLSLMASSRKSLMKVVNGISIKHFDLHIKSPRWSIEGILRHIASAERFYITRLFANDSIPRSKRSKDIYHRLSLMRENCLEILKNLTPRELSNKVYHGNEYWTARKVFRRFLEHEREHTGQILRIIQYYQLEEQVKFPFDEIQQQFWGISWKEDEVI